MYDFYIDGLLLPVTPSELKTSIKNQNKTFNTINSGEINILKAPGLTTIEFDMMIPQVKYPFARYGIEYEEYNKDKDQGFIEAKVYLDKLEKLKVERKVFAFNVIRKLPNGRATFGTKFRNDENGLSNKVSLESYEILENSKNGFDVIVKVKLKQFRDFGTKKLQQFETNEGVKNEVVKDRETSDAPIPKETKNYIVQKGDSLWAIAKKYYLDGNKWVEVHKANPNIKNPNNIQVGQSIILPVLEV